jgi:PAS domain S-box-containing protein
MSDKRKSTKKGNAHTPGAAKKIGEAGKPTSDSPTMSSQPRKKTDETGLQDGPLCLSEAAYQQIVDAMEDSLAVLDADGTILFANNKAAHNLAAAAPSVAIGKNISHFVLKEQAEQLIDQYRRVITTGQPIEQEVMVTLQDADRWFLNSLRPILFGVHDIPAVVSNSWEITERKQAGDRLKKSEAAYRALAKNVPDIVYRLYLQSDRGMRFLNNRITEITGFSPVELRKGHVCSMESHIVNEDLEKVIDVVQRAIRDRSSFEVEYRFQHKNGTILTLLERSAVSCDEAGVPCYVDGVIRDITERKHSEEALEASKQLFEKIIATAPT